MKFASGLAVIQSPAMPRGLASSELGGVNATSEGDSSKVMVQANVAGVQATLGSSLGLEGSNKCYNLYSQLKVNPLQAYPSNPDSSAFGFATCKLCTNGTMSCTSLLYGGKTELIAAHIHLAMGTGSADGSTGEGPPVINFCGKSAKGLISDGIEYPQECKSWDQHGAAHNPGMPGVLIPNFNRGMTVAQRVQDVARRPGMYYFNYHSLASWAHWYPTPHGVSRGQLVLVGVDA